MRIPAPVRWILTLITVNGRTVMVNLPASPDGHVRVSVAFLCELFGVAEGGAVRIGR